MRAFTALAAAGMGLIAFTALYAACTACTVPTATGGGGAVDACVAPDGARCLERGDE